MEVEGSVSIKGKTFNYVADVTFDTDSHYGADADGNRGIEARFLDRFLILYAEDADGNDVTNIMNKDDEFVDRVAEDVLENNSTL
jgi:hypothetical protein